MPLVEREAEVTLVVLVYRSLRWLDWMMQSVEDSKGKTRYRWLVVSNDATEEVNADPRIGLRWVNEDPQEFYINRVYRSWNAGVIEAPTPWVVMLNSDMAASDWWLDELLAVKHADRRTVPTSNLIESGRLPSGIPEHVENHGMNPDEFRRQEFVRHADNIRAPNTTIPGRLYMPILIDRQEFMDVGMYPEGNPPGTTGDKDLIRRYAEAGYQHVTAMGSVVYHVQTGEQLWP